MRDILLLFMYFFIFFFLIDFRLFSPQKCVYRLQRLMEKKNFSPKARACTGDILFVSGSVLNL